jgi:hypothetical protein
MHIMADISLRQESPKRRDTDGLHVLTVPGDVIDATGDEPRRGNPPLAVPARSLAFWRATPRSVRSWWKSRSRMGGRSCTASSSRWASASGWTWSSPALPADATRRARLFLPAERC